MRRWLIAAGIVVVVLGSVLAIATANLGRFLGAHRDRLADRVARELGRAVEFGAVGVTLWNGPGVRVSDVRIVEDADWGGGDLLRADEVLVTVRLLPALVGRFEIRRIALRAPVLTVIRDQRGWNLDTLGRRRKRVQPGTEPPGRERARTPLLIGLADVRDGEIRVLDRRREPAVELVVHQLDVSASDVVPDSPIAVTARAAVLGAAAANLEVEGQIGPLADAAEQTPVDLRWTLDGADAEALARSAATFDVAPARHLIVVGPVSGRGRLRGRLEQFAAEATLDASPAAIRVGTALVKPPDLRLVAELALDRTGETLAIRRGTVQLGDATLDATGSIRPADPPTVDLRLDSNRAPLGTLASVVPAAGVADAGGTVEAHLMVQGALGPELPAIAGTIALADVRARRSNDGVGLSDLSTTITVADGVARMPVSRFRAGDASGEASGAFRLGDRLLTGEGKASDVFGGTVEGRAQIELADAKQPRFALAGAARGVALGPLLAARGSRLAPHVAGRLDADVSLAGAGVRRRAVRRSLTGTARIDVHDGVLRGINLVDEVLGAATGVERADRLIPAGLRRKRPELFGAADTQFEELRATARIADRRAVTDDLVLRTPSYTVTGRGSTDFDGHVDLNATFLAGPALTADVLATVKDARWVTNDQQLVEVPFRVAGRFPALRPEPDPTFVARAVSRALAARARKALGGKDGEGAGGLVDDALRGLERLFGR